MGNFNICDIFKAKWGYSKPTRINSFNITRNNWIMYLAGKIFSLVCQFFMIDNKGVSIDEILFRQ